WSGELLAFALDPNNGNIITTTPIWNAGTQLNSQLPSSRVILTYNPTTNTGIPFTWDTSALSVTQQADLNMGVSTADTRGSDRVAYLRGDRTYEGTLATDFRKRSSNTVLGDIAHSNPVYIGAANLLYPDTAPFPTGSSAYSAFKTSQASRPGVIYVGANDGMLHGFSAATGNEVLAYIPHNLFSANASEGLHYLTEKTYGHRYYVDLGTTISDAFIASVPSGAVGWKTVLLGSERGGGRGVFALDITNPSSFSQSGTVPDDVVMWEFTHADLGYTFSKPAVALMKNGRWAAIFGNGYNDTGDGKAKLFIVYLDGGLDGVWSAGTDYLTITTGAGSTSARNGLASPNMIDTNADKVVDRIYAGDLEGNMWVFDVSGAADTSWDVAYKQGATPKPLFTAKNAAGTVQPITSKPSVARHVSVTSAAPNLPNLMVYFGTGQYIATGDTTSTATQTFYGVWDSGVKDLLRADLTPQTITTTATRTLSNTAVAYTGSGASQRFGWYIDLNASNATTGERVVVDSLVRGNEVYFNTLIPNNVPCSFGGSGWSMRVNRDNGGIPGAPVFDTDGNGVVNGSDNVNVTGEFVSDAIMTESKILGNTAYISTSD
ncbi:MAG: type IV pilus assembly protein PilY1, partial [Halothiobacillaceae bacterium]